MVATSEPVGRQELVVAAAAEVWLGHLRAGLKWNAFSWQRVVCHQTACRYLVGSTLRRERPYGALD